MNITIDWFSCNWNDRTVKDKLEINERILSHITSLLRERNKLIMIDKEEKTKKIKRLWRKTYQGSSNISTGCWVEAVSDGKLFICKNPRYIQYTVTKDLTAELNKWKRWEWRVGCSLLHGYQFQFELKWCERLIYVTFLHFIWGGGTFD